MKLRLKSRRLNMEKVRKLHKNTSLGILENTGGENRIFILPENL